jgi:hypothetical protein
MCGLRELRFHYRENVAMKDMKTFLLETSYDGKPFRPHQHYWVGYLPNVRGYPNLLKMDMEYLTHDAADKAGFLLKKYNGSPRGCRWRVVEKGI